MNALMAFPGYEARMGFQTNSGMRVWHSMGYECLIGIPRSLSGGHLELRRRAAIIGKCQLIFGLYYKRLYYFGLCRARLGGKHPSKNTAPTETFQRRSTQFTIITLLTILVSLPICGSATIPYPSRLTGHPSRQRATSTGRVHQRRDVGGTIPTAP